METSLSLKIELNVAGERILHQMQMHNERLEHEIIEAFEEVITDIDIKELIKASMKKDLESVVWNVINRWGLREDFKKALSEKIDAKIYAYADKVADAMSKQLKIEDL